MTTAPCMRVNPSLLEQHRTFYAAKIGVRWYARETAFLVRVLITMADAKDRTKSLYEIHPNGDVFMRSVSGMDAFRHVGDERSAQIVWEIQEEANR